MQLSLVTAVATDIVPPENTTAPEITVTEVPEMTATEAPPALPLPTEEVEEITELERLEDEEDDHRIRRQRKPKKLIIDKKIILKSDVLKKWQQNTTIYCKVDIFKLFKKTPENTEIQETNI